MFLLTFEYFFVERVVDIEIRTVLGDGVEVVRTYMETDIPERNEGTVNFHWPVRHPKTRRDGSNIACTGRFRWSPET